MPAIPPMSLPYSHYVTPSVVDPEPAIKVNSDPYSIRIRFRIEIQGFEDQEFKENTAE
jgi:hypothetical protein